MSTDIARAYCAPYNSWANRIAVHRFVQDIPVKQGDRGYELVTQVSKTLGRLDHLPVFIGWGEKDFVFDDFFLQEWLQRFPNAELHRYPDCGHYVLEDAGLELVPLISTFLESHPL
jgi:haloalkane dehalogenase